MPCPRLRRPLSPLPGSPGLSPGLPGLAQFHSSPRPTSPVTPVGWPPRLGGLLLGLLLLASPQTSLAFPADLTAGGLVRLVPPAAARLDSRASIPVARTLDPRQRWQLQPVDPADGPVLEAQVQPAATGQPARLWWVIPGTLPAGATRTWRLQAAPADAPPADRPDNAPAGSQAPAASLGVQLEQTAEAVSVTLGGQPVLRYNVALVAPPANLDRRYGRSGHIHPAHTPGGRVVTDQFPPDHAHQSGLFLAFTKTEFEGRTPNFWDLQGGTGLVRCQRVEGVVGGAVFGELQVVHEHVDLSAPRETVALREQLTIRIWNLAQTNARAFVCDWESRIDPATRIPLVVKQYHYGGMALRGARGWTVENSRFVSAEGRGRADGNHTRPKWCDLWGPVEGESAGLALMTHPDNLRFPEPLRIHPQMPYMVYSPAQLGDFTVSSESGWTGRYRFVFHDGPTDPELLTRLWEDFAEPLRGEVSE